MRTWMTLLAVWILAGCVQPPAPTSLTLSPSRAAISESVTAQLSGLGAAGASVTVARQPATVTSASGNTLVFRVPTGVAGGPQTVVVRVGGQQLRASLSVLGKVSRTNLIVMVKAGVSQADFQTRLTSLGLGLTLLSFRALGGSGACSGAIAVIGVPVGQALGLVLDQLQKPEQADVVLQADPQSLWDVGLSPLPAIGAPAAHARGRKGSGVTIAVLDTGVSAHPQLSGRLLAGFDFVDEDTPPIDDFDDPTTPLNPDGHGTPVAVLAAGTALGVAPLAQVLPLRIGDSNGQVLGDRAVRGVCYALAQANPVRLVLNLSFGGDTPMEGLRLVLEYALQQKALVVVAAGNQGDQGSPTHYPAAFDLPGLIAVGALNLAGGTWIPATFSTRGAYVDIAAPGQTITSGNPLGSFSDYSGTSFATPLVAGALALWRQAQPEATPVQLEQSLKANVLVLPQPKEAVGSGMLSLGAQP